MKVPIHADVHCTDIDGPCGSSQYVILHPVTEKLTHVVVRDRQRPDVERLVPLELLEEIAPKRVWLSCTRGEFRGLRPFIAKEYRQTKKLFADYDADSVLVLPYVVATNQAVLEGQDDRSIPASNLALRRGARVEATNGSIGTAGEFVIDPMDGSITHLLLKTGHPWGEREIAIPVPEIERVKDNVVHLRLNKMRVGMLPSVDVLRKWT